MIAIDFFQKKNLTISFAGSEVTIEIDDTIYLNSQKTKDLLSQMDFSDPDKQLANTLKAKELVWQLHEMLRQHLNRLGSRDRDYDLLEKEYRLIETANCFLFYGIQFLQGKLNDFAAMLDNVFAQMN